MATKAGIVDQPLGWEQDLLLAKRCVARDPLAIRELTGANNQRLFRAAWSILKDRSEAEEAVQSTFGYDLTQPDFWHKSLDIAEARVNRFLELAK